ncbi:hypothetical protein THAOC_24465, partial [Thalassiosira oceanica]
PLSSPSVTDAFHHSSPDWSKKSSSCIDPGGPRGGAYPRLGGVCVVAVGCLGLRRSLGGGAGGVGGGTGEHGTSGRAADGAAGLSASGSFSCLSAAAAAVRRSWRLARRGVGWVGHGWAWDLALLAAQPTGPGPLVYLRRCVQ